MMLNKYHSILFYFFIFLQAKPFQSYLTLNMCVCVCVQFNDVAKLI
jgi:hypothetical protein